MLNHTLLATVDHYNEFTSKLRDLCLNYSFIPVKTRNNLTVEVIFEPANADEGRETDIFRTLDYSYVWYANGKSLTSWDLDLIEIPD